jgi:hypothetical protein
VGFSLPHVAVTALVAGVAAYALLRWRGTELREADRCGLAVAVALGIFALRWLGNVPALNDDVLPAISFADVLGFPAAALAALPYWRIWPGRGAHPPAGRAMRGALASGLLGFVVNVVVI